MSLLALLRTDTYQPCSLSLASTAQVLVQTRRIKLDRTGDQDNFWYSKVRLLQHIGTYSNLGYLKHMYMKLNACIVVPLY